MGGEEVQGKDEDQRSRGGGTGGVERQREKRRGRGRVVAEEHWEGGSLGSHQLTGDTGLFLVEGVRSLMKLGLDSAPSSSSWISLNSAFFFRKETPYLLPHTTATVSNRSICSSVQIPSASCRGN